MLETPSNIYTQYSIENYFTMDQEIEKPRLLLNFDINGTLILKDSSKNVTIEHMLISALAEYTISVWEPNLPPMSFKRYVYDIIHPGDKSDAQLKKLRQEAVGSFLNWLKENSHPIRESVAEKYRQVKEKYKNESGELTSTIFPSFFVLLEKLREMEIPFSIILRTFGPDLFEVVDEISEHPMGVKFTQWGNFKDKQLILSNGGTITKVNEIFQTFLHSHEHFAIRDDWNSWHNDGELGRSGKPFIYDGSGRCEGVKNISLFFDDNITGQEQDIIYSSEITGDNRSIEKLYNRLVIPVKTIEAMLDDDYYVKKVISALK